MVRVPKRASKRQSTKQRVKVQKKVREHHRKARRDAKKNPEWRSKKKADPGIPNSFPFKEQLLDEIQMKREREEQRKLEERERRIAERKQKKGLVGDDDDEDEDEQDSDDEEEEEEVAAALPTPSRFVAAPQYTESLEHLLADKQISDVVVCLDARDPSAWRVPQVETTAKTNGKAVHLAITRSDLVPLEALASHMHTLSASSSASLYPISARSVDSVKALVQGIQGGGKKKVAGVAVVGLEYSGRSTLATLVLNLLEGGKVFDTPHLVPHVVRSEEDDDDDEEEEEEEEDEDDEMDADDAVSRDDLSTFSKRKASALQTLLRNKGQVYKAKDVLPLLWALLSLTTQPEDLMMLYNVPAFGSFRASADLSASAQEAEKTIKDTEEFLIGLARVQGRAKKHGIPDIYAASRIVLRDWCSGTLAYYTTAQGWTGVSKAERVQIVEKLSKQLSSVTSPRKQWKKDFVEATKERRDLHPSPAIGELRLKAVGAAGVDGVQGYAFWAPRAVVVRDEDDDEEDDEEMDEDEDEDEELDSDELVPDSDEEEEDEDDE